jgi:hypothetical protein
MTRESQRYDRVEQFCTRRKALAGGATILATGGTIIALGGDARAKVALDALEIPDATLTGETVSPVANVDVRYEYDIGEQAMGALRFALTVGGDVIASSELVTDKTTYEGTTDLAGPVTDSTAWTSDDFSPAVASSVTRTLSVGLSLTVVDPNDAELASATASEEVSVVIEHPRDSKVTARVGGQGVIRTATNDDA